MDIMANRIDDSSFDSLALSDTDSCASQLPTPVDDDFFTPKDSVESLAVQGWTDDFDDGDSFLISGVVWDQASGQHLLTAPRQVSRKSFYDYYYPPLQPNHWQEYYREQERLNVKSDNRFSGKASVAAPSDSEPGPIPRVDLSAAYISSDGVEQSNEVEDLNPDPECVYTVSRRSDGLLWYQCKTCPNRGTDRRSDMVRHAKTRLHKAENFTCTLCNMEYPSKDALERHFQRKSHQSRVEKNKARYNLRKRVGRK
uniref:C2H2-type domain-containing protein n=1 Tax=Psilocybe cubensis TaxID=181762 RepID=A0A8H7XMK4_PSICU